MYNIYSKQDIWHNPAYFSEEVTSFVMACLLQIHSTNTNVWVTSVEPIFV